MANGKSIPKDINYKNLHDSKKLRLPYVGEMNTNQQQRFIKQLENGNLKCYSIVREPKSRILSAYLDKILFHENTNSVFYKKIIPKIREEIGIDSTTRPTFKQFLTWIRREKNKTNLNPHWKPMSIIIGDSQKIKIWRKSTVMKLLI